MSKIINEVRIWVCVDCMLKRENDQDIATDHAPWSKFELDHDEEMAFDFDAQTGDGFEDFSSRDCEGCGSPLAGERWRYIIVTFG